MTDDRWPRARQVIQESYARRYTAAYAKAYAKAYAQSIAESIIEVLDARGLPVSAIERHLIEGTTDLVTLRAWIRAAVQVEFTAELFETTPWSIDPQELVAE